jgi:hypothetical protein
MNSIFAAQGFQRSSSFVGNPLPVRPRRGLGDPIDKATHDAILATISAGNVKIAAVRRWIASLIDKDPMLQRTITKGNSDNNFMVDNFWSYDDLVTKDQWYVDQATANLNNPNPSTWDLSQDTQGRVSDWGKAIDIMYAAMQEFGGAGAISATGVPNKLAPVAGVGPFGPTGAILPTGPSVLATAPSSSGITTKDILIGGAVALGAGALLYALL